MAAIDLAFILVTTLGTFCLGLALGIIIENRQFRLTRMNLRIQDLEDKVPELDYDVVQLTDMIEIHEGAILRLRQELEWISIPVDPEITQELPLVENGQEQNHDSFVEE